MWIIRGRVFVSYNRSSKLLQNYLHNSFTKTDTPFMIYYITDKNNSPLYYFTALSKSNHNIDQKLSTNLKKIINKSIKEYKLDDIWDYTKMPVNIKNVHIESEIKIYSVDEL